MKQISFLFALFGLIGTASFLNSARADFDGGYCEECHGGGHHHGHDGDDDLLVSLLSSYTAGDLLLGATAVSSGAFHGFDARIIYIQNVKDDAAAFLAGDDESALLAEAIQSLRSTTGISGTDEEIASKLLQSPST